MKRWGISINDPCCMVETKEGTFIEYDEYVDTINFVIRNIDRACDERSQELKNITNPEAAAIMMGANSGMLAVRSMLQCLLEADKESGYGSIKLK